MSDQDKVWWQTYNAALGGHITAIEMTLQRGDDSIDQQAALAAYVTAVFIHDFVPNSYSGPVPQ